MMVLETDLNLKEFKRSTSMTQCKRRMLDHIELLISHQPKRSKNGRIGRKESTKTVMQEVGFSALEIIWKLFHK